MTAEQLEELLAMLDNGHALDPGRAMDELFAIAPSLARRVICAEKLVEALWVATEHNALYYGESHNTVIQGRAALTAYREASK